MSNRGLRSYRRAVGRTRAKEGRVNTKRWLRGNVAVALAAMVAAAAVWAVEGGTAAADRTTAQTHAQASAAALVQDVAAARAATAKYVTNLALAKRAGYGIITKMIPNMGYHFMNP